MSDSIGHYDHIIAKREEVVRNLSPAALHRNFPKLYAKPIPREATTVADLTPSLRAEIKELKQKVGELHAENGRLQVLIAELSKPLAKRRPITIPAVMEAFCLAMDAHGRFVEEQSWTLEDLKSARRSACYSSPRQVCMWLVYRISPSSWAKLAQAFGGRDHTTAIHACRRAREIMWLDPGLRAVAISVMRSFGADPSCLQGDGE